MTEEDRQYLENDILSEIERDTLISKSEILQFKEMEIKKMNRKLYRFYLNNGNLMSSDQLRSETNKAFETGMFERADNDMKRQSIIDSSIQRRRNFCKSKGNTNSYCICALECFRNIQACKVCHEELRLPFI